MAGLSPHITVNSVHFFFFQRRRRVYTFVLSKAGPNELELQKKTTPAQKVRQKSDISERTSKPPSTLTLFATRPTVSLCDLSGVILHQKWIQPFLSEIWCWLSIFSKKAVFSEKTAKNCFGGAFDNFLEKEGVLRQKLT